MGLTVADVSTECAVLYDVTSQIFSLEEVS